MPIYGIKTFGLTCSKPGAQVTRYVTVYAVSAATASLLDVSAPVVKVESPDNDALIGAKLLGLGGNTKISASATDNTKVETMTIFIDGIPVKSLRGTAISYNWNTKKTSRGQHTIQIKATDTTNNLGSSTVMVIKQ